MTEAFSGIPAREPLLDRFLRVRRGSERLAAPLSAEDRLAQSMPDASPTKWHLAHTTWFFETFVLGPRGREAFDPAFSYLFNSYYETLGARQPRPQRGLITRPSSDEVSAYRQHVDAAMTALLEAASPDPDLTALMELGFAHEEQHQELILTDILHLFSQSALKPAYRRPAPAPEAPRPAPIAYLEFPGGLAEIGHAGAGFAFDNEGPRHTVYLRPFRLADRLSTNAEWMAFINDDGYRRAELWLSEGWSRVQAEGWTAPMYWTDRDGDWWSFSLRGEARVRGAEPVSHISYFEADAFARWSGRRLPSEAEWEVAAPHPPRAGNFAESDRLAPRPAAPGDGLKQMFGEVWEWTCSAYLPYPGFRPAPDAIGEYNGKFMINQMVLRGGSCFTPQDHIRATYRNFFQTHQRWQMSGVRLADDGA